MQHKLKHYQDGHKRVIYCENCGLEEDEISDPVCVGTPVPRMNGNVRYMTREELLEKYPNK